MTGVIGVSRSATGHFAQEVSCDNRIRKFNRDKVNRLKVKDDNKCPIASERAQRYSELEELRCSACGAIDTRESTKIMNIDGLTHTLCYECQQENLQLVIHYSTENIESKVYSQLS